MDHEHLPALTALLFLAPLTVLLLAMLQFAADKGWPPAAAASRRIGAIPARTGVASLALLMAGTIHLALVPGHSEEPVLASAFVAAGLAGLFLAGALVRNDRWRWPAGLLLGAVLGAYAWTRVTGFEPVDVLGVATGAVELIGLAALAPPTRVDGTSTEAKRGPDDSHPTVSLYYFRSNGLTEDRPPGDATARP